MSLPIAIVIGTAAGGAVLLAAAVALALWCAARLRGNRSSDTGSSDPSTQGELLEHRVKE
jgi:hypothetical protein